MKPKKQLIEAAEADGSMERMNMLLSAAHLLNCEANSLIEEASDIMAAKGLMLGDLKKLHNDCDCENFGIFSTEEKAKSFIESHYPYDSNMFVTEVELDKPVSF